jgi:hypothetical protein
MRIFANLHPNVIKKIVQNKLCRKPQIIKNNFSERTNGRENLTFDLKNAKHK